MTETRPHAAFYTAQGLRLHYADWGKAGAPTMILIHGGADHCRAWDDMARRFCDRFHVVAPDLRGHGDSQWAHGSSYPIADYVHDITRLVATLAAERVVLIGHSMGGMIALMTAGTLPQRVDRLVVLDGITVTRDLPTVPIGERMAQWITQLDGLEARQPPVYPDLATLAARLRKSNPRLAEPLALHLARHGTRAVTGGLVWKTDPYQRARAPYRLSPEEHRALWQRITCPTLLLRGDASFLPDPRESDALAYFKHASYREIADAGHWLHHDQSDAVADAIAGFLARA